MLHLLLLCYLAQLAQGTSTNTTDSVCPPDGTTRSIWSVLGNCILTLLICVWHAIHFNVPQGEWGTSLGFKGLCVLGSFVAPEVMVAWAVAEWKSARHDIIYFRERGYQWSMTHSFFSEMGGFVYRDDKGLLHTINSNAFLELCKTSKIANPAITTKDIKDRSKSDVLGKTILAFQLFWFMLQVVVRGSAGLAVTLLELDTVCMAILSLIVLFFWWDKPLRPECPYIFYSPQEVKANPQTDLTLCHAWRAEPGCLDTLMAYFIPSSLTSDKETASIGTDDNPAAYSKRCNLVDKIDNNTVVHISLCASWMILGGLHLVAWNFDFPTETEKILWRSASLALAAGPLVFFGFWIVLIKLGWGAAIIMFIAAIIGLVSRVLLMVLTLASLRALPLSAYRSVSWISHIPHL